MCSDHYYPTAAAPRRREEGDSSLSGSVKLGLHIFDIDAAMSNWNWNCQSWISMRCRQVSQETTCKNSMFNNKKAWCKLRTFYHSVDVNIGELYLNS